MDPRKKKVAALMLFTALGFAAGILYTQYSDNALSFSDSFSQYGGIRELYTHIKTLCSSTFLQAALIFASGFTIYPLLIDVPVLALRAFAMGNVISMLNISDEKTIIGFVSYLIITVIFIPLILRADLFRKELRGSVVRKTAIYAYSFLIVSGASIIIKILPIYISYKLI